jgi:hypothetical protein
MKTVSSILIAIALQVSIAICKTNPKDFPVLQGLYFGQEMNGQKPELFAENILANKYVSFHSTIVFNPGGNECYWQCNIGDNKGTILWSRIENGKWTLPEIAPFAMIEFRDDCPFISPDGNRLFFLSRRPLPEGQKTGKENIWLMDRIENGWSKPIPLPLCINSMPFIHWQISVDQKGTLFFSTYQNETSGRRGNFFFRI